MSRSNAVVLAGLVTALAVSSHAKAEALQGARAAPMSFEELMAKQRAFDGIRFSPDGRRAAFGQSRFDAPSNGFAFAVSRHEAFIADLKDGKTTPLTLKGGQGAYLQACNPWRPDGAGVALISSVNDRLVMAYGDAASGEVKSLGFADTMICGFWVGDHLVYQNRHGASPGGGDSRALLGHLTSRWESAWKGEAAPVTIHSSNSDFPAPSAPDGALIVADSNTGGWSIAAEGQFDSITPSPDGKTFAVIKRGATDLAALDKTDGRLGQLHVFKIGPEGVSLVHALHGYDIAYNRLAWARDGRLLAAGRGPDGQVGLVVVSPQGKVLERIAPPPGVVLTNAKAGQLEPLLAIGWVGGRPAFIGESSGARTRAEDATSEYGQDRHAGRDLYVVTPHEIVRSTGFTNASVEVFTQTPDGEALVVADGALWRIDDAGRARKAPIKGYRILGLEADPGTWGTPTFTTAGHGEKTRVALRAEGGAGAPSKIVAEVGGRVRLAAASGSFKVFSPDLENLAALKREGWATSLQVDGRDKQALASTNADWRDRLVAEPKAVTYQVDGRTLTGWVISPPQAKEPPPALVWIYGGQVFGKAPPGAAMPEGGNNPLYNGQLWVSRGYAVIYPSTPLGQGAATDMADSLAKASVAAVDAAAARGLVDPQRVGIIGHSFGGFSSASVLAKRSDRFAAGVAISGVFDFLSAWGTRQSWDYFGDQDGHDFSIETKGYVESGQGGLGAPPWEAPQAYLRASPMFQVKEITAPLMLMVGDLDLGTTDLKQTERFYAALRRAGNPSVMVRYWGQRHVQDDPSAVRDQWKRIGDWFDHYVKQKGRR